MVLRHSYLVLIAVAFMHAMDRTIMNSLVEPVKVALHLSDGAIGALAGTAFGLAYACVSLPVARIVDFINRRRVLLIAIPGWSVTTFLCGLAGGYWTLFAARFAVATFEAAGESAVFSLIADSAPPLKRAGAASVAVIAATIGAIVGSTGAGLVAGRFGWRMAFWLSGFVSVIVLPFAVKYLREPRAAVARPHFRHLFGAGLQHSLRELLSKSAFVWLLVASIFMTIWMYGTLTWFTAFLIRDHGIPLAQASLAVGLFTWGAGAIGCGLGGWGADRLVVRNQRWLVWLPGLYSLATFPFAIGAYLFANAGWTVAAFVAANLVFGATTPVIMAAIFGLTGVRNRAFGLGIWSFCSNLIGFGLGPVIVGVLSDALSAQFGRASLRISLITVTSMLPLAGLAWFLSARTLNLDLPNE